MIQSASQQPTPPRRQLIWTTPTDANRRLSMADYDSYEYSELVKRWIAPARVAGSERETLANAAAPLMEVLSSGRKFAVLNVPEGPESVNLIWAYVVEPGFRRGCDLLVTSEFDPEQLDRDGYLEEMFGYARPLECLLHLMRRYRVKYRPGWAWLNEPEQLVLDSFQAARVAVAARLSVEGSVVDFALPKHRLAVEIDEEPQQDRIASAGRDERLRAAGWQVVRFDWRFAVGSPQAVAASVADMQKELPTTTAVPEPSLSPAPERETVALDTAQARAATAGTGVIQVLAPAGSGKTKTLVARVSELVNRGVQPETILCASFNAATRRELKGRIHREGVRGTEIHTFNSLGLAILKDAGSQKKVRDHGLSIAHWGYLCNEARKNVGTETRIQADRAQEVISDYKLGLLMLPQEAVRAAANDWERTKAELYVLYQQDLDRKDLIDFDDQILLSVRLLREDPELRIRWQDKFEYVLVDEYQDIEPSQELLILMLAAPDNNLFAVGDEDQCIYSWRRAAVERIVELDQQFPGLDRVALQTVYRCPPSVVSAASRLIANNRRRFPKVIRAREGRVNPPDSIDVSRPGSRSIGLDMMCSWVKSRKPRESCILARTNYTVEDAAVACAKAGIPFHTENKFTHAPLHKVEMTVRSYLRLALRTQTLEPSDIDRVFATPSASLPESAEHRVFAALSTQGSVADAVASIECDEPWRADKMGARARLVDGLAEEEDAERFVRQLRSKAKLDAHFSEEAAASPHQPEHLEVLKRLEAEAQGLSSRDFALQLDERERLLREGWSEDGIDILTIHGAKGREWEHVLVLGVQEGLLPIEKAADMEEERRLAYVAMTRAKSTLKLIVLDREPSRFLVEAGLLPLAVPPKKVPRPPKKSRTEETIDWFRRARKPVERPKEPPRFKKERPKTFHLTIHPCPKETRCRVCSETVPKGADAREAIFSDGSSSMVHPRCASG